MRSKSANQLTLDYSDSETDVDPKHSSGSNFTNLETVNVPAFEGYGAVYAAASRRAGRINASNISGAEHEALLLERQLLLDKKFNRSISRKESNRLEYVRWSLDRIEDAKHGWAMDVLEHSIGSYEQFSEDLKSLRDQLNGIQRPK